MTETTSPTNLNADLESSVERTNTTSNSSEIHPELISATRSDDSNSYSPIMENYNSPTAPLTVEPDDATARLLRIRDELAQQVRERDNAARQLDIQKEIDELQNSLDRTQRLVAGIGTPVVKERRWNLQYFLSFVKKQCKAC